MGSIYAERILAVAEPRVGVLSNGEEEGKGNDLTRAASAQLAATFVNFIGYVEGRDIFNNKVDVVVCDGFTGNIALKTMEGVASFAGAVLKAPFKKIFPAAWAICSAASRRAEAYRRLGLCGIWRRAADWFGRRGDHRSRRLQSAGDQECHSGGG